MPDVIPVFLFSFWQKVVMSLINDIILFLMNITVQTPPQKKRTGKISSTAEYFIL